MVVCLLKEPKHNVAINGIEFTPYDIKGLLVKVVHTLPLDIEHIGWRYPRVDAGEPTIQQLYKQLPKWSHLHIPVIVDVDSYLPVWNWPFSKISIDFDNGVFEISSEGFPEESRRFGFDWEANKWTGELSKGGKSKNPDFLWIVQSKVDLYKRDNWAEKNASSKMTAFFNPLVSPRNVFDIYIRSIDTERE